MDRCAYCGEELNPNAHFCPNCGRPRTEAPQPEAAPKAPLAEAEYEIEEAEYEIEEAEDATAQPSEWVDHVIVERETARPQAPREPQLPREPQTPREPQAPVRPAYGSTAQNEQGSAASTSGYASWQDNSYASRPDSGHASQPAPRTTGLSIVAFICSLSLILCGLGAILAIVDLVKGKSEPRKKGLSVAALIISGIVMVTGFIGNRFVRPKLLAELDAPQPTAYSAFGKSTGKATAKPAATKAPANAARATAAPTKKATAAVAKGTTIVSDSKIVSILYGNGTLAGLRADGTVTVQGFKAKDYHMDVSDWSNMVSIAIPLNGDYLLGLRGDGTVAITGQASAGEIWQEALTEIRGWKDMVYIHADQQYAFGVRSDGTVAAVKLDGPEQSYQHLIKDVGEWKDMRTVTKLSTYAYGRKADGSWVTNDPNETRLWLQRYPNTAVFYGRNVPYGAALSESGSVNASMFLYGEYDLDGWQSIQKLVVLGNYAVGLRKDGTLIFAGDELYDKYYKAKLQEALSWRDVADIASYGGTLVALLRDGSLKMIVQDGLKFDETAWKQVSSATQEQSRTAQAAGQRLSFRPYSPIVINDASEKMEAIRLLQAWEKTPATKWTDYAGYSRGEYVTSLKVKGVTNDDVVWFALENCGINWNEHAARFAQNALDKNDRYSLKKLLIRMINDLFTEDEMIYAAQRLRVDFRQNAVNCGAHYMETVKNDPWTREWMIRQLEFEGFTSDEATYAANKLGLK